jgi:siroheme synthase-like protein
VAEVEWPDLYPVFLKLRGLPVLVVGAGEVGARKIAGLLAAGADVTVVAPEAIDAVAKAASKGRITWCERAFEPEDVDGKVLVVAATPESEVGEAVARASRERGAWVNVSDDPDLCSFYLPSVVDRKPLQIAVSTAGASPAYARELRKRFERLFDPEAGKFVELLGLMREKVRQEDPERVGEASRAFVESEAEEMWLGGDLTGAREVLEKLVEKK